MKSPNLEIERYRVLEHPGFGDLRSTIGKNEGVFFIPCQSNRLRVIASDGEGWDHVSVSLANRCPNWDEMKLVKELFFRDDEPAFQIFPAKKNYRNCHPFCLHWWRPQREQMPLPDPYFVAPEVA